MIKTRRQFKKVVNQYSELLAQKKAIETQLDTLKSDISEYIKSNGDVTIPDKKYKVALEDRTLYCNLISRETANIALMKQKLKSYDKYISSTSYWRIDMR